MNRPPPRSELNRYSCAGRVKAPAPQLKLLACAAIIAGAVSAQAHAQDSSLNIPGELKNAIGIGTGGGFSYSTDSPNFTISADYGRVIAGPWGVDMALGWDKEFRKRDGKRTEDEQIDLSFGITYALTGHLGLAAGFSKSLFAKEDGAGWKTAGSDEWGVGAALSYSYPLSKTVLVGPGFTLAYDLSDQNFDPRSTSAFPSLSDGQLIGRRS